MSTPETLSEGILFEDVQFRYPGSEHLALNDFSLFIPAGKTVAIVGPNGAGKTTVTKLLCRFYDPTEGSIRLDGTDLRSFDLNRLRRLCTVLFQSPVHYIATVAQNIVMGDRGKEPTTERIACAVRGGGADEIVSRLPMGYETLLGKQFRGGVELSGGQWQRISLARAFYRESPIVILDEPTSFMDSWAESAWLDHFRELVKDRTAIIVTHRFTTAMRADVIHVMNEGKVVESGSHRELIDQNGLYASSWLSQIRAENDSDAGDSDDPSDVYTVRNA